MTVDAQILKALRTSEDGIAGTELARVLGISRAAVWARIEELRSLGYDIEASPHHGYRLQSTPDLLHADDLIARLPDDRLIGRDIRVFNQTGSTNEIAERMARDKVAEGMVIFAESQTGGRGRLGRRWSSPPGKGLWFSVLLRPDWHPQEITRLTVAAAVALRRAIRSSSGIDPEIKWPNDLMYRGHKLAGILTELAAEVDRVKHVVIGIGINVNVDGEDLPEELRGQATSLKLAAGSSIDRPALAARILIELDKVYTTIADGNFMELADEWAEACRTIGNRVSVVTGDRRIVGQAESLDSDGALLVRNEHGSLERVVGGDVFLEK